MASLHICFATMTGNAETLAGEAHERAVADGLDAELVNLIDIKADGLTAMHRALFVVSTWGDGDPPDDAEPFWQDLETAELDLSGLTYSVLGLGDKDYPDFNGFARKLDARLAALGARRLTERFEADLDFDPTFSAWTDAVFAQLAARENAAQ